MAKDKGEELKIEGEVEKETRPTPDVAADFTALLKDYGVAEKAATVITRHIADTGSDRVFENPRELIEKLAKFPRQIPPVTRKNVVDHWIAQNKIPVPEGYEEEAELPAEELRHKRGEGKPEAKYSVNTETGGIKVASTSDKTALTWDEAEQLSEKIKKEVGEKEKERPVKYIYDIDTGQVRMAREGEMGGTLEEAKELKRMAGQGKGGGEEGEEERERAKYSVDEETGVIKVATTKEKALTWEEAEKLSKSIKKEVAERGKEKPVTYVFDADKRQVRMAKEGEIGGTLEEAKELKRMAGEGKGEAKEEGSPFITDEEGNWILNPKARVTGVELMALESIRRSQEKGEPVDPIEALGKVADKMKIYQEAFGGGAGKMPDWMTDPVKFVNMVQTITGGGKEDEKLKDELSGLKKTIDDMKEEKYRDQILSQQAQIRTLTDKVEDLVDHVADLKRPVTGRTEMDILHDVATQGIDLAKSELPGFRRDFREAFAGTRLPPAKNPEEREKRKQRYRKGLDTDQQIEQLGRELFFGEQGEASLP